ncbi:acyl-CoA dehydrogenase [Kineosporia succinea]|uniref:Alkylation response protein AidB-like acyl-CoA dehydrogenase n=1 Tax=Kineosporia succinea TaxID=84632 RepID=A0ABT9P1A2_9ACTN|nr:acyl-CoA dehydrogenase [Kineosporia succinea]MDP9826453.1 alkylation response protein AidB-like acyl-CoA dehydrogenase [Kineosporia succinea]
MSHYRHNLRDVEFNLFEVFGRDQVLGTAPFEDIDGDTAREMLREMARLATEDLAPSTVESDRNPPVFDPATHSATLPESFVRAYNAYVESGFWQMGVPEEIGGVTAPSSLRWSMLEFLLGANPAIHMYATGFDFANILYRLGTPEQQRLAALLVERRWGATMVLTEPDAGSDVGAGRTRAVQAADGTWQITGVKRFITSGDSDLSDNIVHFVLARPEGAGPGTKGLSLFLVPKFQFDLETGELGERNGVFVTNVEHKMGLKVSTTCEVRFGEVDGIPATGTLLGEVHNGIAQMFKIIEGARMMVGTKAIATLSSGYLNALDYAKERVQGADLTQMADKSAPRVTITHHPDVRRSLMTQKAYAEGMRALVQFTATQQDAVKLAELRGERDERAERLNDFLLPIVKGFGSERAWHLLGSESLQTFGGSGFLQDYPLEQYVRDAKIDTLYEGTTAIQGTDFFFRKIVRDKGQSFGEITELITEFAKADSGDGRLAAQREVLGQAVEHLQGMVAHLVRDARSADPRVEGADVRNIYKVGQNTTRLLLAAGDLLVGWLLLRQADVATTALEGSVSASDRAFYQGKIAAAGFFAAQVLPRLAVERSILEGTDNSLMDLDEASF